MLARPDLADDPRLATNHDRATHRAELQVALDGVFATRSRAEWMTRLQDANVPAGPVRTIAEAFASPEMIARGIASDIPHPAAGSIPNIAPPFRFSRTPAADPVAAPLLGQHAQAVLTELLGHDETRLDALAACGVLGNTTRHR